jgi:thiol-disulfide isomerase/thioredoxin
MKTSVNSLNTFVLFSLDRRAFAIIVTIFNVISIKIRLIATFLLLTSTIVFAQVPKGTLSLEDPDFNKYFMNTGKIPTVEGKILNLPLEDLEKIKISYSIVTPFYKGQNKKITNVNSDGSFSLLLDYPFPYQQIWLSIGDTLYTCLYVNSDLHIELDAAKIDKKKGIMFNGDGVRFSGTDGELTNLMNNHILFKRSLRLDLSKEISGLRNNRKLTTNELLIKYDDLYSKLQIIDNEFIKKNPSDYVWLIENEYMSSYYADLFSIFLNSRMDNELWERVKKHKSYSVSNDGMSFYRYLLTYITIAAGKYRINDWNAIGQYSQIDEYGRNIIDSMTFYQKASDLKSYNKLAVKAFALFSDTLAAISTMKTITFLDTTFIPAKADYLKMKIGSGDPDEQKIMYDLVLKNITTDWCKSLVNSDYQKTLERIVLVNSILKQSKPISSANPIGQPIAELPFDAKLYKVNNIKPTEFLTNLKESFTGKALLIDFWATWCGPCIMDMPYSKKLHDETKDLPVEFIYLCTSNNSSLDKWKSKIVELKIPGTHIFVEETTETELMNLFSVNGFPSIVFISRNGGYKPGVITFMSKMDKNKLTELINKASR